MMFLLPAYYEKNTVTMATTGMPTMATGMPTVWQLHTSHTYYLKKKKTFQKSNSLIKQA